MDCRVICIILYSIKCKSNIPITSKKTKLIFWNKISQKGEHHFPVVNIYSIFFYATTFTYYITFALLCIFSSKSSFGATCCFLGSSLPSQLHKRRNISLTPHCQTQQFYITNTQFINFTFLLSSHLKISFKFLSQCSIFSLQLLEAPHASAYSNKNSTITIHRLAKFTIGWEKHHLFLFNALHICLCKTNWE